MSGSPPSSCIVRALPSRTAHLSHLPASPSALAPRYMFDNFSLKAEVVHCYIVSTIGYHSDEGDLVLPICLRSKQMKHRSNMILHIPNCSYMLHNTSRSTTEGKWQRGNNRDVVFAENLSVVRSVMYGFNVGKLEQRKPSLWKLFQIIVVLAIGLLKNGS